MHACALLHNNVNNLSLTSMIMRITSHSPACFFCWPHQPELHAAFLLVAACVLVVPAAGALVLAFSALRPSIWGSHTEAPYKKQQLKKAMPSALLVYGGPAAGQLRVLCLLLLLLLRARCSLCCCCCCCSCCSCFYCY
jgi:hypothetical protein